MKMGDRIYDNQTGISTNFLSDDIKANNIGAVINRYRNTVWNDFHHESFIDIGYRNKECFCDVEKWCHEHHLLYTKHVISDKDAKELGKSIDEIITPLVQRRNNISIYDTVEYKPVDYIQEGFDPITHGLKLIDS